MPRTTLRDMIADWRTGAMLFAAAGLYPFLACLGGN
jgi:hypothetical protein